MYSYAGMILSVDLTDGVVEKIPLDEKLVANFIGGMGINAKLAYDLIGPGTEPLSPDNVLIFGAGALVGTMVPTAARACAMAKSPLSGLLGISHAGHMAAMLKFAGYDHLIIRGRAKKPVFLLIEDDKVEIRDAQRLWGKDTSDTTESLWREFGEGYYVSCIGPAGENLVRFACIMNNKWSAFGRTGLGAVMGSKNLKAIAIYGTKGIRVAKPGRLMRLVNKVVHSLAQHPKIDVWRGGGTWSESLLGWEDGKSSRQAARRSKLVDMKILRPDEFNDNFKVGSWGCLACPIGCKAWLELQKGKNKGLSFGISCTSATMNTVYGLSCAIPGFDDIAKTAELGQRYGLSSIDTAGMIQFAIELYDNGVINKNDSDGLELKWGDAGVIQELMRKITFREGFGGVLADGVIEASRRIGKKCDPYVSQIKGTIMPPEIVPDLRAYVSPTTFGGVVNPRGWHHDQCRYPHGPDGRLDNDRPEAIRKYAKQMGIRKEIIQRVLAERNVPLFVKHIVPYSLIVHCLGICDRPPVKDVIDAELLTQLYSAATGIDIATRDLLRAGERIWNIERAFNVREGASRKDDTFPERHFREPFESYLEVSPPLKRETFEALLDEYYAAEGWDKETGKPTTEKLEELGLDDVARDLEA